MAAWTPQPRPPCACPPQETVPPSKHLPACARGWWARVRERRRSGIDPATPSPSTHVGAPATWAYRPGQAPPAGERELQRHTREQSRQSHRYRLRRCISKSPRTVLTAESSGRSRGVLRGGEYSFPAPPSSPRGRESQPASVECSCWCPVINLAVVDEHERSLTSRRQIV